MSDNAGPRTRRKGSEAREAVLRAGVDILLTRGPAPDPLGVELSQAIAAAGIPKSTGYRLFSEPEFSPQDCFARDLVVALFGDQSILDPAVLPNVAAEVLAPYPDDFFETGSSIELAVVLRELIRLGATAVVEAFRDNLVYWSYMSAYAAVGSTRREGPVAGGLATGEETSDFVNWYQMLQTDFGLRLRGDWTWHQLDAAISTAALGGALRAGIHPHLQDIMRATGPGGELQSWNAAGVTIEGIVLAAAEPNPRVRNAANISTWLR